ncbi:MAG TPA: hypothetical protein H9805_09090, partial [Candidatus Janibacter merdipullorum]|nr:hypothetical protein [Candidatus Janibacter merdipullorum]
GARERAQRRLRRRAAPRRHPPGPRPGELGIRTKDERLGKTLEIVGLNEASAARHERLSGRLGAGH